MREYDDVTPTSFYTFLKELSTKLDPSKWQFSLVRHLDIPHTGVLHFFEEDKFYENLISRPVVEISFSELEEESGYSYTFETWVFPSKFPDPSPELKIDLIKDFYKVNLNNLPKKTTGYNDTRFYLSIYPDTYIGNSPSFRQKWKTREGNELKDAPSTDIYYSGDANINFEDELKNVDIKQIISVGEDNFLVTSGKDNMLYSLYCIEDDEKTFMCSLYWKAELDKFKTMQVITGVSQGDFYGVFVKGYLKSDNKKDPSNDDISYAFYPIRMLHNEAEVFKPGIHTPDQGIKVVGQTLKVQSNGNFLLYFYTQKEGEKEVEIRYAYFHEEKLQTVQTDVVKIYPNGYKICPQSINIYPNAEEAVILSRCKSRIDENKENLFAFEM